MINESVDAVVRIFTDRERLLKFACGLDILVFLFLIVNCGLVIYGYSVYYN